MKTMLRWISTIFIIMALILLSLKWYAVSQWPDLSTLSPLEPPKPSTTANPEAWITMEKAMSQIPPKSQISDLPEAYRVNYKSVDLSLWRKGEDGLKILEKMKSFQDMQMPPPSIDFTAEIKNMAPLTYLLKASSLKSWELLKNGEVEEAIENIKLSAHTSHLLRHGNGDLLSVSIALGSYNRHLNVLDEILEVQGWESLERYRMVMNLLISKDDDYMGTLKALKYEALKNDDMFKNPQKVGAMGEEKTSLLWKITYDPDATRAYALLYWKKILENASQPYVERQKRMLEMPEPADDITGITSFMHNSKGKELLSLAVPNFIIFVNGEDLIMARQRVLIVLCAARLYMWENEGKIPESVEELIPKYLPSAPKDPFASASITLKDGEVFSAMHHHKRPMNKYYLHKTSAVGGYLLRRIATPNPVSNPPIKKKKQRRRRKRR